MVVSFLFNQTEGYGRGLRAMKRLMGGDGEMKDE